MSVETDDLRSCSLLAIFAHPDDESLACGGLLARCAHLGVRVAVCCATGGELGATLGVDSTDPGPEEVRRVRFDELRRAAGLLGVADLVLLDFEDGYLPWVEAEQLDAAIRDLIVRLHPDVVITFGEDGLYGHPDHIAIYERTTAVVAMLGESAPALYYVTMPEGQMRGVVRHAAATLGDGDNPPRKILGIADADAFGAIAALPTLVVEAGPFAAIKLAAIHCHKSQLDGDALAVVDARDAARLIGTEQFHRAQVGSQGDAFIERFASTTV